MTSLQILRNPRRWWISFCVAFAILLPLGLVADREPPYARMNGMIRPPNPEPGGIIEVEWEIKINRECPAATDNNLTRRIIDSDHVVWGYSQIPTYFGNQEPQSLKLVSIENFATRQKIVRTFKLPQGIARGPATYISSASFVCDFFHLQRFWPIIVTDAGIKFHIGN